MRDFCILFYTETRLYCGFYTVFNVRNLSELLDELKLDFSNRGTGTTVHLTEDMMDRFIEKSFGICCEELEALNGKNSKFNYLCYTWSRA